MFKKSWIFVFLFSLLVLADSPPVFAATDANGVRILMTDNNTTVPISSKTLFELFEVPYVHYGFPAEFLPKNKANISIWIDPDINLAGLTADLTTNRDNWYTINNWDSVKKACQWDVYASYLANNGSVKTGSQILPFNVAPEPVSSTLFLLGGGALAVRAIRRKLARD